MARASQPQGCGAQRRALFPQPLTAFDPAARL